MNLFSLLYIGFFLVLSLIGLKLFDRWSSAALVRYQLQGLQPVISCIKWGLFGLIALSASATLGLDIRAFITGLGVTGFALSFAIKDALSNSIAGILLILYRPFTKGQEIKIELNTKSTLQGTVNKTDLRYTTLENDTEQILIPNAILFTNAVTVIKKQH